MTNVSFEDGVKHQLSCQYCSSPLALVWEVRPGFEYHDGQKHSYNYQAKCPFCGGESARKTINGEVRILSIVEEKEVDGHFQEKYITKYNDVQHYAEDELCLIIMDKA